LKKIIFLLVIIVSYYGCKKDTNEIKGVVVNLIANDDPIIFKKSVILFDDSNYLIKIPIKPRGYNRGLPLKPILIH